MSTHWKKMRDPAFLGSWDFEPGEEKIVTITKVANGEAFNQTSGKTEKVVVIHFKEICKPMILNVVNSKMIAQLHGTQYIEEWAGKQIILRAAREKIKGVMTDCIRVKNEKPVVAQQQSPQCSDCNGKIVDKGGYSAQAWIAASRRDYQAPLCADCVEKRKAVVKDEQQTGTDKR